MFDFGEGPIETSLIIGTCVSFVVSLCRILSFQIKSMKALTICQALASLANGIAFIFFGAWQGVIQNFISTAARFVSLYSHKKWAKHPIWIVIFSAFYLGFSIYFYPAEGWRSLLTGIVMIPYIIALWSGDAIKYKINYFCTTAPAWLIYDLLSKNIFAAMTEGFNMVSIAVFFVRRHFGDKKIKN